MARPLHRLGALVAAAGTVIVAGCSGAGPSRTPSPGAVELFAAGDANPAGEAVQFRQLSRPGLARPLNMAPEEESRVPVGPSCNAEHAGPPPAGMNLGRRYDPYFDPNTGSVTQRASDPVAWVCSQNGRATAIFWSQTQYEVYGDPNSYRTFTPPDASDKPDPTPQPFGPDGQDVSRANGEVPAGYNILKQGRVVAAVPMWDADGTLVGIRGFGSDLGVFTIGDGSTDTGLSTGRRGDVTGVVVSRDGLSGAVIINTDRSHDSGSNGAVKLDQPQTVVYFTNQTAADTRQAEESLNRLKFVLGTILANGIETSPTPAQGLEPTFRELLPTG